MRPTRITGVIEDKSGRRPFVLSISSPEKAVDGDYYFCRVDLESVTMIGNNVRIAGQNAGQARSLALSFLRKMLADKRLFDDRGRPLKL